HHRSADRPGRRADGQPRHRDRRGDPEDPPGCRARADGRHRHSRRSRGRLRHAARPPPRREAGVTTLLKFFSWRYLRRHPIRVFLSVMSVALGVALFASIDISNTSTEAAFRRTVKKLSGHAQLQVVRAGKPGVEEDVLRKLEGLEGVQAAPVVQVSTTVPGMKDLLLVMGLDLQREATVRTWDTSQDGKPQIYLLAML